MRRTFKTAAYAIAVAASIVLASILAACTADEQPDSAATENPYDSYCFVRNHDGTPYDICEANSDNVTSPTVEAIASGEETEIMEGPGYGRIVNDARFCPDESPCDAPVQTGDQFTMVCIMTDPYTGIEYFGFALEPGYYLLEDNFVDGKFWASSTITVDDRSGHIWILGFMPVSSFENGESVSAELKALHAAQYGDDFPVDISCSSPQVALTQEEVANYLF